MEPSPRHREEHTLKADPAAQLKLLDLQAVDATLDALTRRLHHLPEHESLAELTQRRGDVTTRRSQAQIDADDLARAQRKADADVEQVKARRTRNRERIDAGLVSDPKQLQAMQHETGALDRRISDLEDEEIAVMEQLEEAQHRYAMLTEQLTDIEAQVEEQTRSKDAATAEIQAEMHQSRTEREKLSSELPADLVALYDRLRASLGGIGVGAIQHGRCGGCRLQIGTSELARFAAAPPEEVLRCEECNRILVRTEESGLTQR